MTTNAIEAQRIVHTTVTILQGASYAAAKMDINCIPTEETVQILTNVRINKTVAANFAIIQKDPTSVIVMKDTVLKAIMLPVNVSNFLNKLHFIFRRNSFQ